MPRFLQRPWPFALWVAVFFLAAAQLTRLVLLVSNWSQINPALGALPGMWLVGTGFDLVALSFALLPVALFDLLLPRRWPRLALGARAFALTVILFSLFFNITSEMIFWGEFGARFNFIAVDYLVYTHEVFDNIMQSYPVVPLCGGFLAAALLVVWFTRRELAASNTVGRLARVAVLGGALLVALLSWSLWPLERSQVSGNQFVNELAANGYYTLFHAYRHNELDYARYYTTLPEAEIQQTLARLDVAPGIYGHAPNPEVLVATSGSSKPRNVVLITVESLSADYLGQYGNPKSLSPNLDRIAKESLSFTNLYAAGTRTVRGLEALSLSVPPTPGQSIVRRPGNEEMATLGAALNRQGYHSWFLYGGYGYFDNMNYYFSHNGYEVLDHSDVPDAEVGFANAWGMADEYIYQQAIKVLDRNAGKQPQFIQIMTTSNHRPYTYPGGRIDIPSPGGHDGAVKYTDFAIGQFLADAQKHAWFKDTVFVIVADHCASSAGKTSLPTYRYHIPAMVYAPGFVKPQQWGLQASQIDLPPTILALLGLKPEPRFFGRDILSAPAGEARALIANYQELGYLKGNKLVVLAPQKAPRMMEVTVDAKGEEEQRAVQPDPALVEEAIAYYQGAAESFKRGALKLAPRDVKRPVRSRA